MAKTKNIETEEREDKVLTPQEQAAALFKVGKADIINYEESKYTKTPSSSLIMNSLMNGGLPSGASRAVGNSAGGKSSCSLDFMFNFLKPIIKRKGVYCDSEGKLNENIKERSGIKFTTNPAEWEDGTCLILQTNVFEFVFKFMGDLMRNNPTGTQYFFVVDSLDMLSRRDDLIKPFEDSAKVAGGAVLTSVFLKQTSAAMAKRGHYCIFISQVRDAVKIDPRQKTDTNKQGKSSGGHAVEHGPEWVLDFQARWQDDIIREVEDDKNSKPIGHYCKINIVKSNNETYGQEIRYPIKYGRIGGKSVWVEKEVADFALMWDFAKKARNKDKEGKEKESNTYVFSDELMTEFKENNIEVPEKLGTGLKQYNAFLDSRPDIVEFLYNKFSKLLE